jgi:hypothetical protein
MGERAAWPPPSPSATPALRSRRVGLVGCVKQKGAMPTAARDLYTSPLFLGRRRYVERSCERWWILSAAHRLVDPDDVIAPYDVPLKDASVSARRRWAADVLEMLAEVASLRAGDVVEIHAGAEYRNFGLVDGLLRLGCTVENPTAGLGIGSQLKFYSDGARRHAR